MQESRHGRALKRFACDLAVKFSDMNSVSPTKFCIDSRTATRCARLGPDTKLRSRWIQMGHRPRSFVHNSFSLIFCSFVSFLRRSMRNQILSTARGPGFEDIRSIQFRRYWRIEARRRVSHSESSFFLSCVKPTSSSPVCLRFFFFSPPPFSSSFCLLASGSIGMGSYTGNACNQKARSHGVGCPTKSSGIASATVLGLGIMGEYPSFLFLPCSFSLFASLGGLP